MMTFILQMRELKLRKVYKLDEGYSHSTMGNHSPNSCFKACYLATLFFSLSGHVMSTTFRALSHNQSCLLAYNVNKNQRNQERWREGEKEGRREREFYQAKVQLRNQVQQCFSTCTVRSNHPMLLLLLHGQHFESQGRTVQMINEQTKPIKHH